MVVLTAGLRVAKLIECHCEPCDVDGATRTVESPGPVGVNQRGTRTAADHRVLVGRIDEPAQIPRSTGADALLAFRRSMAGEEDLAAK